MNTDEHVLRLAKILNIDIGPWGIDRTHRVGPVPVDTDSIADGARPRPREIIVKLKSYQARLRLLYRTEKHCVKVKKMCTLSRI